MPKIKAERARKCAKTTFMLIFH